MVASAYAAHLARRGADFGVSSGAVSVDMAKVAERARRIILDARHGNEDWLQGMPGLELVRGHAAFLGPGLMAVGERRLSAPGFSSMSAAVRLSPICRASRMSPS